MAKITKIIKDPFSILPDPKRIVPRVIPAYLKRPTAILKMPSAIESGLSANRFLKHLRSLGLGYNRQRFLADWRSVGNIQARKDVIKYTRKDRLPSIKSMADVEWNLSQEYMFKVSAKYRTDPEGELQERFVNIPSDRLMTPQEVINEVFNRWDNWEKYGGEELVSAEVVGGYHRINMM